MVKKRKIEDRQKMNERKRKKAKRWLNKNCSH